MTSFPRKGRGFSDELSTKSGKPIEWLHIHFPWTNSHAHLFQNFFSLLRLVGKAAQKELSQLDGEVGEESKVSYNIRGDALWEE